MDLKNKTVMVVGTGISGIGAVDLLNKVGADCILYDGNEKLDRQKVQEKLGDNKAEIISGAFDESLLPKIDLLVISPGVPIDSPIVLTFKNAGIPVWGEIELAYNYDKGKVIAITGTNGKTTTTALVGQIIAAYNEKTFVVGNIGNSYTGEVLKTSEDSYTVAEISSFQLDTMVTFKPHVTAILNITPDHLDRHKTLENYIAIKESITKNQAGNDFCVLNYNDPVLREFGKTPRCKVIFFSSSEELESGVFLRGETMFFFFFGVETSVCTTNDSSLVGMHNYENIMAAIAMTHAMGVPLDTIRQGIKEFTAVEHRIEFVAEKNGV